MIKLSEKEEAVLREIQGDLPLDPHPFAVIGARVGLPGATVLDIVRDLMGRGVIRRMGAILRHRKAGVKANAMGVWRVLDSEVSRVGKMMAEDPGVTHCYHRDPVPHWPYNLYTMIHGETEEDCERIAERLSKKTGVVGYRLLFSTREFKKESLKIF